MLLSLIYSSPININKSLAMLRPSSVTSPGPCRCDLGIWGTRRRGPHVDGACGGASGTQMCPGADAARERVLSGHFSLPSSLLFRSVSLAEAGRASGRVRTLPGALGWERRVPTCLRGHGAAVLIHLSSGRGAHTGCTLHPGPSQGAQRAELCSQPPLC